MISKKAFKAFGRKKYLAAAIPLIMAAQAQGFEFFMGDMEGSLDSQISMGSSWRTEGQDAGLIQGIEGTETNAANNNDGDLNYTSGDAFSQIFKGSHDLQVSYGNYGAFVRGKYWYDAALEDDSGLDDSDNHELAKYSGAALLDAFVYGEFEVLNMPLDVRLGKQVVSWGEGTFIRGGVNQINPIDVSSFRRPGAEIKEGLIPVNMLYTSLGVTENLSAEAFYQLGFQETVISSCGTFFATNDYAPEGCNPVVTAAGTVSRDTAFGADGINSPDADGQFGVAFRYFSEALDTEFGFYALNIHSRVPLVSGRKATVDELGAVLGTNAAAAGGYAAFKNNVAASNALVAGGMAALGAADWAAVETLAASDDGTGTNPQTTGAVGLLAQAGADIAGGALAGMQTDNGLAVGSIPMTYHVDYPEDQQIAGLSFATNAAGLAISGELTHKLDVPFQINATQLLSTGLQTDATYALNYAQAYSTAAQGGVPGIAAGDLAASATFANTTGRDAVEAALGSYGLEGLDLAEGEVLAGFKTFDVTQLQVTAIQLIDQVLGASRFAIVGEAGYTYVHDFKSDIKFDGNGDGLDTVTEGSWGYRARIVGQYNDVFSGVNLSPVLSWSHDVEGVAPAPGGNFIEDEKVLGFTLNAEYQNTYTGAISYTQYSGGITNSLVDRDFASISVGMQF